MAAFILFIFYRLSQLFSIFYQAKVPICFRCHLMILEYDQNFIQPIFCFIIILRIFVLHLILPMSFLSLYCSLDFSALGCQTVKIFYPMLVITQKALAFSFIFSQVRSLRPFAFIFQLLVSPSI